MDTFLPNDKELPLGLLCLTKMLLKTKMSMLIQKTYKGICWICGAIAGSGEHIYKRSDLVREFATTFESKQLVSRVSGENDEVQIQGPKSNKMKFKNCLCFKCNNERTQPFDFSFDTFNEYFKRNELEIFNSKKINLEEIFGDSWEKEFRSLQKYYAKHIGCVLVSNNIEVLPDIVRFIQNDADLHSLKFNFALRSDIFDFMRLIKEKEAKDVGYLGRSSLRGEYSPSKNAWYNLQSSYIYRSLELCYYYSNEDSINSNFIFAPIIPMATFGSLDY